MADTRSAAGEGSEPRVPGRDQPAQELANLIAQSDAKGKGFWRRRRRKSASTPEAPTSPPGTTPAADPEPKPTEPTPQVDAAAPDTTAQTPEAQSPETQTPESQSSQAQTSEAGVEAAPEAKAEAEKAEEPTADGTADASAGEAQDAESSAAADVAAAEDAATTEQPAAEESAAGQSAAGQGAGDDSPAEEVSAEGSAADAPAAEKAAAEPAEDEPSRRTVGVVYEPDESPDGFPLEFGNIIVGLPKQSGAAKPATDEPAESAAQAEADPTSTSADQPAEAAAEGTPDAADDDAPEPAQAEADTSTQGEPADEPAEALQEPAEAASEASDETSPADSAESTPTGDDAQPGPSDDETASEQPDATPESAEAGSTDGQPEAPEQPDEQSEAGPESTEAQPADDQPAPIDAEAASDEADKTPEQPEASEQSETAEQSDEAPAHAGVASGKPESATEQPEGADQAEAAAEADATSEQTEAAADQSDGLSASEGAESDGDQPADAEAEGSTEEAGAAADQSEQSDEGSASEGAGSEGEQSADAEAEGSAEEAGAAADQSEQSDEGSASEGAESDGDESADAEAEGSAEEAGAAAEQSGAEGDAASDAEQGAEGEAAEELTAEQMAERMAAEQAAMALITALMRLRGAVAASQLPIDVVGADEARQQQKAMLDQLDDYILPRLVQLEAPVLAVVGGSTGAGKSTLVNTIIGKVVSEPGVLRPTTRSPVLIHHPADAEWFAGDRVLPGMARSSGDSPGGTEDPGQLRLVAADTVPQGLAILDAPDIDSVVEANRDLATQLLAAADLWLFVTTAARYADAVPWDFLQSASDRSTAVAVVLDRAPEDTIDDITGHLAQMLLERGLGDSPLFSIRETVVDGNGMLPADTVASIKDWLIDLAADAEARAAVVRRTLHGAVTAMVKKTPAFATAVRAQAETMIELRSTAETAYDRAVKDIAKATQDGTLLRGEVLARWQEFVGTGELLKGLQTNVGRMRDKMKATVVGKPPPTRDLNDAVESGLESLLREHAEAAAERAEESWQSTAPGRQLLAAGDRDLGRMSKDFPAAAGRAVRDWQGYVLDLVRKEGADKRSTARILAYGVNGLGLSLMVVIFASTAGITGAEVGVGAGTAVVGQKLLEAVFGDQAVRTLVTKAREDLDGRVHALMDAEFARYLAVLDQHPVDPEAARQLTEAARAVEDCT
ncbi:hypothetical protein EV652_101895 [Kribbella steppae]|uniref:Dynamin family protein n=1 Tax=Kribbella steppae TaxID=2512223 RepID=A0A4R2HXE5_9ACTN|nr:AAA family ATPase [Kribbella steppae]TCO36007.1 hypothetical protein EV652_101895 [Kribbella steppae]